MTQGRPDGFFCTSLNAPRPTDAERFLAPNLLNPRHAPQLWKAYASAPHLPHLALDTALVPAMAETIAADLDRAPFESHHHAAYNLDVCRRPPPGTALARFFAYLGTPAAARTLRAMFGDPRQLEGIIPRQVQISRMAPGQGFARHVDTHDDGITVVFNFSRGFGPGAGGVLEFFADELSAAVVRVPPVFNRAVVFRPAGALHTVTAVTPKAPGPRYTVTAFFLARSAANTPPK